MLINWDGKVNPNLSQIKIGEGAPNSDKERVEERRAEYFGNLLNQGRVIRKDIEENEKVCDTLDVMEDLFCKEELATVLKGLKNNKAPGANTVVNEFLKYGGSEFRN